MALPPSGEPTIGATPSVMHDLETIAGEPGSAGGGPDPLTLASEPTRLGHHVLLHVLGRGGMGVVYAAYDEQLDRKVAIKLLLGKGGATVQRRLAREAQALARLSHPNVVQIYEIGEHRRMAFLVMEFIDGETLGAWLAAGARPRAQVIATFVAAGRGLAAAHAQGLIHRDFKPDNVMIRRDGRVVVMDFGLARGDDSIELEPSPVPHEQGERTRELSLQLTQAGAMLGTPAYMAPEQFRGAETDARTDQFSFCVALWEALYRQRPFSGANLATLAHAVLEGERIEPSGADVPAWLRAVLDRGLARDPAARWPSMNDLLAALERDPTRRRRAAFAGSTVLALTVAGVVALGLVRERERDSAIARCERDGQAISDDWNEDVATTLEQTFLATQASFAGSTWAHARPAMDEYARSWSALRSQTCHEARVERTRTEDSLAAITQCLDQRRATFVGLIEVWGHADRQLVTRAPVAALGLSPVSGCLTPSGQDEPPPAEIAEQVAALRVAIERVRAMLLAGEYEPALAPAFEILAQAETLAWLPSQAEARLLVAHLQLKLGKYSESRESAEAAFLDALRSGDEDHMERAAQMLAYLVGYQLNDPVQGEYWAEVSARLIARLELTGTTREAGLLEDLGLIQAGRGRFAEAIESQRRALAIEEAELGPDHPDVGSCHINLGLALAGTGDFESARQHFEAAITIKLATLGPEHPDVATAIHNIAIAQMVEGRYTEALTGFERALSLREAALGPDHPQVAQTLGNIGYARYALGQTEAAKLAFDRALVIYAATYGPDHSHSIGVLNNLGLTYGVEGDDEQALVQFRKALAISEARDGASTPDAAGTLINIADVLLERGAWVEAGEHYSRALACLAEASDHPWRGLVMSGLARVELEIGDRAHAHEQLVLALAIEEQSHAEPIELAKTRFGLARVAWDEGDESSARAHAEAARGACAKIGKVGDRLLARIDAWLAERPVDHSP